jgi:hypothetical protein
VPLGCLTACNAACTARLRGLCRASRRLASAGAGARAGGGIYLVVLSRELALACAASTAVLWLVALRFGGYSRRAQRSYQDTLADTNQVRPGYEVARQWRQNTYHVRRCG